jgi:hypothetical protein
MGSMFIFEGFLAGLGSVLTFGWAKKEPCPLPSSRKIMSDDWYRIGKDIEAAISNYKLEKENDKA